MSKTYIAGPMRKYDNFNFDAFDDARNLLHTHGFIPISPADMDRLYEGWGQYPPINMELTAELKYVCMRRDTAFILTLDAEKGDFLTVLPGWENSRGAIAEVALAIFLDLKIYNIDDIRNHYENKNQTGDFRDFAAQEVCFEDFQKGLGGVTETVVPKIRMQR